MKNIALKKLIISIFCFVAWDAGKNIYALETDKYSKSEDFYPGVDSARFSFEFKTPRKFASRFLQDERMLQIRVMSSNAKEFSAAKYYDDRYVHRVVVTEENGDTILGLQLKNLPLGWIVTHQENPWRIVLDIWNTEANPGRSLEASWNWQEDFSSKNTQAGSNQNSGFISPKIGYTESGKDKIILKSPVESKNNILKNVSIDNRKQLPPNFGRLDDVFVVEAEKILELRRKAGEALGHGDEYPAGISLAMELYKVGDEAEALNILRRLAFTSEKDFRKNPQANWLAGECAFLTQNYDMAADYYRSIILNHPNSEYLGVAKLRLIDVDFVNEVNWESISALPEDYANKYIEIALGDKFSPQAKIAATLRLLHGSMEKNPSAAKIYQDNLSTCVKGLSVPVEMRKNCAYINTRYSIENLEINAADNSVQQFKSFSPDDGRTANLEAIVQKHAQDFLEEAKRAGNWNSWLNFERQARPKLLDFTLKNPDYVYFRADSWAEAGEEKNAAQLYSLYWQNGDDLKKKNESAAIAAKLYRKIKETSKSDLYLNRLFQSDRKSTKGIGDRAITALRVIAKSPYKNKIALKILLDEINAGYYVERELSTLIEFAGLLRRDSRAALIYEKILAYPIKSSDEIKTVENSVLQYADELRDNNKLEKSADMYLAVANIAQSTKRAESAYKAGLMYARAGLLDKARKSWQLAANDVTDKRYSVLASERLDRIK